MHMPLSRDTTKGALYCLTATVSFGLMFPVMASALTHVDPFTFTSLRYLLAAAVSLVLLVAIEGRDALRLKNEPVGLAWLLGSVGFAGFGFLVFLGQKLAGREGALTASIMAATQPLLGALIHAVIGRVLPPRYTVLSVILSFCGIVLVITRGHIGDLLNAPQNYTANAMILLGLLCWLTYTFGAARFTQWSPLKYTTLTMCFGLTTIVAINTALLLTHTIAWPQPDDLIFIIPHILYMGLVAGMMAVWFWNLGSRILTPLNAVLFMNVVPLTAFTVSAIFGVVPAPIQIAGACITGAALILNNLYPRILTWRTTATGKIEAGANS